MNRQITCVMNSVTIDCLTTKSFASFDRMLPLLTGFKTRLNWASFQILWMEKDGTERIATCKNLDEPILSQRWSTGAIALQDLERNWEITMRWCEFSNERMQKQFGFRRQNEVSLCLSKDFEPTKGFLSDPFPLVNDIYRAVSPNYLVVRDSRSNAFGLSASAAFGLVDIYWINVFGPPYVRMFTQEKLNSLPSYRAVQMPDGGIFIQMSKALNEIEGELQNERRKSFIKKLGYEYFKPPLVGSEGGSQFSVFNLVRMAKSFAPRSKDHSTKTPELDWEYK